MSFFVRTTPKPLVLIFTSQLLLVDDEIVPVFFLFILLTPGILLYFPFIGNFAGLGIGIDDIDAGNNNDDDDDEEEGKEEEDGGRQ